MRANGLREKLKSGGTVFGMMATEFYTPGLCQIAANAGADFVIYDMEHGGVGVDTLKSQFAYARGTGLAAFVRVPTVAYHLIATILDAGASGIMTPMVETREQAEMLANSCRYRPEGFRGIGFGVGHDDYRGGDVVSAMRAENDNTLVIALIETAKGIANADAILSVPGIDVGWLGHYDLTNSMGITAEFENPRFHQAVATLIASCRKHGKATGFLASTIPQAREWRAKGIRCLCYGIDSGLLQRALGEALTTLRADGA